MRIIQPFSNEMKSPHRRTRLIAWDWVYDYPDHRGGDAAVYLQPSLQGISGSDKIDRCDKPLRGGSDCSLELPSTFLETNSSRAKIGDMDQVYLDHAASTPVDPRVLEAMRPYFSEEYGNPSSVHFPGQRTEAAVERAREQMAAAIGADPREIIFTSCGTESDNIALRGAAFSARLGRGANHILTTPVEHPAVLKTVEQLDRIHGFEVEMLPVDRFGRVSEADLRAAIRDETAVVSVIYANNEIGSINPISSLADVCRQRGVLFHTDAVQAASQIEIDVDSLSVDLLALGAHKFYGPKGIGALYVREGTALIPPLTGGSQEFGLRPGTHNVPLISGMARALQITVSELATHNAHYRHLRDQLIPAVLDSIPDSRLTGHPSDRLPNHASFAFKGVDGNALLAALDMAGFACSSGSACKTGLPEPSRTVLALGLDPAWAMGSLRVTVGRNTTGEQIEAFLNVLPDVVERTRHGKLTERST